MANKNGCAGTFTINEAMEILNKSLRGHGLDRFNLSITCHMHNNEESAGTAGTMFAGETGPASADQKEQPQPIERTTPDRTDEPPAWLAEASGARQPAANSNGGGSVRRRLF